MASDSFFMIWLSKNRLVIGELFPADLFKFVKEIFHGQFLLLLATDVKNNLSFHHHDQTVSMSNVMASELSEEEKEEILRLGLRALNGEE